MTNIKYNKKDFTKDIEARGNFAKTLMQNGADISIAEDFVWKDLDVFYSEIDDYSLEIIESFISAFSKIYFDGHYTIFRFTTGYKLLFMTPDICGVDRQSIFNNQTHSTMKDAFLTSMLAKKRAFECEMDDERLKPI